MSTDWLQLGAEVTADLRGKPDIAPTRYVAGIIVEVDRPTDYVHVRATTNGSIWRVPLADVRPRNKPDDSEALAEGGYVAVFAWRRLISPGRRIRTTSGEELTITRRGDAGAYVDEPDEHHRYVLHKDIEEILPDLSNVRDVEYWLGCQAWTNPRRTA